MFLTPDAEPFWGGTYFPLEPRFGRPGFKDVLRLIEQTYRGDRDKVDKNRTALVEALQGPRPQQARRGRDRDTNREYGADSAARGRRTPRWHWRCAEVPAMFHAWSFSGGVTCGPGRCLMKTAVVLSMERMCQGGIYDHLGGGFARYSTDERWLAPHFEKMLYDNAQLLDLLCHVWQETGEPLFAARAAETVAWALREMRTGEVAFASALDADSEGEEGKFYVWNEAEIDAASRGRRFIFQGGLRCHPGRQLGGEDHPQPAPAARHRGDAGRGPACQAAHGVAGAARRAGSAPAGTTRCWPTGTA